MLWHRDEQLMNCNRTSGLPAITQSQPRWKIHHVHHLSNLSLHNKSGPSAWYLLTCVGDLGRAGAGDAGASIWLGLAVGLGRGETSSGGDGVFAKRSGPESLDRSKAMDTCILLTYYLENLMQQLNCTPDVTPVTTKESTHWRWTKPLYNG